MIRLVLALTGVCIGALAPSPAAADCVVVPPDVRRSFREAAVVFAGTIVHATDDALMFRLATDFGRARRTSSSRTSSMRTTIPTICLLGSWPWTRGCGSPPWPLTLTSELDAIARPRIVR
jgi:hypothetical protein